MSIIKQLYDYLERKTDFDILNFNIEGETISQEDNDIIQMENIAFFDLSVFNDKRASDSILIAYYEKRINVVHNVFLLARYSHVLYLLTHQPNWCSMALQHYKHIIAESFNIEDRAHLVSSLIQYLIQFSIEQKRLRDDIKSNVIQYLSTGNKMLLLYLDEILTKKYEKFIKISEVQFLPKRCYDFAVIENEYIICKRLSEFGLYYATKDSKKFKELVLKFYELLGDNEEREIKKYDNKSGNIIIPHLNQAVYKQMMEYYQKSGSKNKLNYASRLYDENKHNLKYINITYKVPQDVKVTQYLRTHFDNIKNMSSMTIFYYLSIGDPFVFMEEKRLIECVNKIKTQSLYNNVIRDLNQNEKNVVDDLEFNKTLLYQTTINNQLKYMSEIIVRSVEAGKLSYQELEKYLINYTYFGTKLRIERDTYILEYTWLEHIDYALKELFNQFSNIIDTQKYDVRLPIDILSIKFEGILRDIIFLSDGSITKVNEKGNTTASLLEILFQKEDSLIKAGFDINDMNLFKYVLTDKGLNIRNNVAHCFYKPQDYSFDKAILVFLCIMRLTKFKSE